MSQAALNAAYHERRALGVTVMPDGETQGKNPLELSKEIFAQLGHEAMPILKVIRAKCLDCSQAPSEVARCTAVDCPLWPYRMGSNPFRAERSEAVREAARQNVQKARAARSRLAAQ